MSSIVGIREGAEPWSSPGEGDTGRTGVVVVHGFTSSPAASRPLGQWLAAEGYAVDVLLLPGHGTRARDLGRTRYADWYAELERAVDGLAETCARVALVGHSMGGTLSLDLASRRPDDVAAVVAVNAQVLDPEQPLARLAPVLQHLVPYLPRDLAGLPSDDIAMPGVEEGAYGWVSARAAQSLIRELPRVRAQLPDLVAPLLIASSPRDHTVPARNSDRLAELVGSDVVERCACTRSYHLPMLDYDAERLRAAIVAFLAEHATG